MRDVLQLRNTKRHARGLKILQERERERGTGLTTTPRCKGLMHPVIYDSVSRRIRQQVAPSVPISRSIRITNHFARLTYVSALKPSLMENSTYSREKWEIFVRILFKAMNISISTQDFDIIAYH